MRRKIAIALIGIAAYRLVAIIPLPGIDVTALSEFFGGAESGLYSGGAFSRATVMAVGIRPYLGATVIVLLLSGLLPRLRRLRDGTAAQHARMDRLVLRPREFRRACGNLRVVVSRHSRHPLARLVA